MSGGSFRERGNGKGSGPVTGGGIFASGSGSSGSTVVTSGGPEGAGLNNYSTFFSADPGVRTLLRTSDSIEQTRRTVQESEEVAKNVMVDLELQRSQLHDMKGMVTETSSMTGQVRNLLQIIADRSYRKKICLWSVIVALAITDMLVFYLLFLRN